LRTLTVRTLSFPRHSLPPLAQGASYRRCFGDTPQGNNTVFRIRAARRFLWPSHWCVAQYTTPVVVTYSVALRQVAVHLQRRNRQVVVLCFLSHKPRFRRTGCSPPLVPQGRSSQIWQGDGVRRFCIKIGSSIHSFGRQAAEKADSVGGVLCESNPRTG